MRLYFLVVRRIPPVPSPLLLEVYDLLRHRGYEVADAIAEELVLSPDRMLPGHNLYVLKSHTELSLSLAGVLDTEGARLLNPYASCITTQDKIVASRRLRAAGVPIPRGWVTGDLRLLRGVLEECPLIVKPHRGHRGAGIRIIRDPNGLHDYPLVGGTAIVQEYVGEGGEDLKLYVIGDHVFGVRKPFSADSFTRPGRPFAVDRHLEDIARRCGRALGLGLYGLDVVEGASGPVVVDVNYFPGYKGIDGAAGLIADYIDGYARGSITLELPSFRTLEHEDPVALGTEALGTEALVSLDP